MRTYHNPLDLVRERSPERPVALVRPDVLAVAARWFQDNFKGDVFYAVKANPSGWAIRTLAEQGVRSFDVASVPEIELVAEHAPGSRLAFMHPVKSRTAIRRALELGVQTYVVDDKRELAKIKDLAGERRDLNLVVRLAVKSRIAAHMLDAKFGCSPKVAAFLLESAAGFGWRTGLSFHVGSQALKPKAWKPAFRLVAKTLKATSIRPTLIDVGGGFPVPYRGIEPPAFAEYARFIAGEFEALHLPPETELWAEPGRALAAPAMSLIARVELRRGHKLFLNDGYYGSLGDLKLGYVRPHLRVHRPGGGRVKGHHRPFTLLGPTCDSADSIAADFLDFPSHIKEGDWIEFGEAGAYYQALRTRFNGFWPERVEEVADDGPAPSAEGAGQLPR